MSKKPDIAKRLAVQVKPKTAREILDHVDVAAMFQDIFRNGPRQLKLQAWTALCDCAFGKPKQDVGISGGIVHAHTRDPRLTSLPREGLEALARLYDEVLAKYIPNASQDGPHDQIESKPDIEAEVVESKATETEKST